MGKPTLSARVLCLASTGSCQGKTVLCTGLAKALSSLGFSVACFIIGPQSCSGTFSAREAPLLLAAASGGREVQCVDPWLLGGSEKLPGFIAKHCKDVQADVALLVGMRGLYDPAPGLEHESGCTTAQIAKDLKASCILILDGCCSVGSALALLKGHLELDRQLHVPCVLLNRADNSSGLNAASMQAAVRNAGLDTRVLGCMPKASLSTTASPEERAASIAALVTRHVDLEALLAACPAVELRGSYPDASHPHSHSTLTHGITALVRRATGSAGGSSGAVTPPATCAPNGAGVVVAVAVDEVFGPSFPGNLGALEAAGARLVRFSPLHDMRLPDGVQGVYLGGPASALHTHGAVLGANAPMSASLAAYAAAGGVVLAEAAGLTYLCQSLCLAEGAPFASGQPPHASLESRAAGLCTAPMPPPPWPMVGLFPFRAFLLPQEGPAEEGYVELEPLPAAAHLLSCSLPPSPNASNRAPSPFTARSMPGSHCSSSGGTPRAQQQGHMGHGSGATGGSLPASFSEKQHLPAIRGYLHSCVELVEEVRHTMGARLGHGGGMDAHAQAGGRQHSSSYAPAFRAWAPTALNHPHSSGGGAGGALVAVNSGSGHGGGRAAAAGWLTGYVKGGVLASAVHLPFAACPDVVAGWVAACARVDEVAVGKAVAAAVSALQPHAFSMQHVAKGDGMSDCGSPPVPLAPSAVAGKAWGPGVADTGSSRLSSPSCLSCATSCNAAAASTTVAMGHSVPAGMPSVSVPSVAGGRLHASAHQLQLCGVDAAQAQPAVCQLPSNGTGTGAHAITAAATAAPPQLLQRSPRTHMSDLDLSRHLAGSTASVSNSTHGRLGGRASGDFHATSAHMSPRGLLPSSVPAGGGSVVTSGYGVGLNVGQLQGSGSQSQSGGALSFAEGVRRRLALSARSSIDDLLSLLPGTHGHSSRPSTPANATLQLGGREATSGSGAAGSVAGSGFGDVGGSSSCGGPHHRRHGSQQYGCLAGVDEDDSGCGAVHGWLGEQALACGWPGSHARDGGRGLTGGLPPLYGRTHNKMIGLACPLRPPSAPSGAPAAAAAAAGHMAQLGLGKGGAMGSGLHEGGSACGSRAGSVVGEACCGPPASSAALSRSSSTHSMQLAPLGNPCSNPCSASLASCAPALSGCSSTAAAAHVSHHVPMRMPDPTAHSDGIVSMCPGATEALVAMGLAGRLVGVSEGCDWPPEVPGTKALAVRSRVPLLAGATLGGAMVRPGTKEWAAAAAQLAAEGVSQLLVDEDLLREECPGLVVLPALEGLGKPEVMALQRALQRTVLSTGARGMGAGTGMVGGGAGGPRCVVLQHACRTLADVLDSILQLGDAAAAPQAAGVLTDRLRARLRRAAAAAAVALNAHPLPPSPPAPGVLYQPASVPAAPVAAAAPGWKPRMLVLSSLAPGAIVRAGRWVPELVSLAGAAQASPPVPTTAPATGSGAVAGGGPFGSSTSGVAAAAGMAIAQARNSHSSNGTGGGSAGTQWGAAAVAYPPQPAPVAPAPQHASHELEPGDGDVPMSWEELRASAPDVIVVAGTPSGVELAGVAAAAELPGWWSLPAVHAGQVYVVDAGCLLRPGPRVVDGAEVLTRITQCAAGGGGGPVGVGMLPRPAVGTAMKLSLSGGQRCRPRLLPNYIIPWP